MTHYMRHPPLAALHDTPTKPTPEPIPTHMGHVHLARHVHLLHHAVLMLKVRFVCGGQIRNVAAPGEGAFPELQGGGVFGGFMRFPQGACEEVLCAVVNCATVQRLRRLC